MRNVENFNIIEYDVCRAQPHRLHFKNGDTMTQEEYKAEKEKLTKAKKGYDTNRTLCVAVIIFLVYITFKEKEFTSMPWYILLILSLIALATAAIFIHDCILIKGIAKS